MGLQDVFFQLRLPFDSAEAREISQRIQEEIYYHAVLESSRLAEKHGSHPTYAETRAAMGKLQMDLWDTFNFQPKDPSRWTELRARIAKFGLRNSLMIAIAPTATIASIVGSYEAIEPQVSNVFKRETLSGEFLQVNRYLVEELRLLDLWNDDTRAKIKLANGSIQGTAMIPDSDNSVYRTVWEIPMKSLVDMAADRGPFIDQSASLNLFMESPNIGKLSSMYMYAWEKGLKTTYYLRSRPATEISKTLVAAEKEDKEPAPEIDPAAAVACSLENPETCEVCQ